MNYLIYTTVKDQAKAIPKLLELRTAKDKASARVVNFWYGEIEGNYSVVYVGEDCERVAEAYRKAGVEVRDLFDSPKIHEELIREAVVTVVPDFVAITEEVPVVVQKQKRGRPFKE